MELNHWEVIQFYAGITFDGLTKTTGTDSFYYLCDESKVCTDNGTGNIYH
jgi:hypothetical protein